MVERVLAVCPDAGSAAVRRDLLLTGSCDATINRILDGQACALPTPPSPRDMLRLLAFLPLPAFPGPVLLRRPPHWLLLP